MPDLFYKREEVKSMNKIIKKLENKIIVSCQAGLGEPFYKEDCLNAMMASVLSGGAEGLRLAGERDIRNAKQLTNVPVIGITKPDTLPANWKDVVYITPTFEDAQKMSQAGADIIALDGTSRPRPKENLAEILDRINKELGKASMADVSTLQEGIAACMMGADVVSTTLSGYTTHTIEKDNGEPDFALLKGLVEHIECPVILEGRVWTPEQTQKAFDLGAYAVVIGSAITRPHLITKRFVEAKR